MWCCTHLSLSLLLQIHEAAGAIVKLNTLANELPPSPEWV